MTEPDKSHTQESAKEAMRAALDRKKAAEHEGRQGFDVDKEQGHTQGPVAGRRQFRRKAGG